MKRRATRALTGVVCSALAVSLFCSHTLCAPKSSSQKSAKQKQPSKASIKAKTAHIGPRQGDVDGMLSAALAYRGVRYRYGGMTSRGFDCSGLVARVLLEQGVSAPHNSAALYQHGVAVERKALQPGDLVFFRTSRRARISHVGIYLGEDRFIHASSGRGRVRTDSLSDGYYAHRYVGARRIITK